MTSSATTPDPRRWAALALLAVAQFVVVLDASIMNIALPSIGQAMHVSTDTLSWVVNAYVLAFGGLLLLGGRLADLLGRRRVFIGGLVVFGVASLAGGLSSSAEQLIAARAVQGVGAAALAPAALSIVTALFAPGAERNRALSIWGAVAGSGGVAGVLLGGLLTSGLGWEWVLFVNVPVALGAAVLAPRLFSESRGADAGGRVDVAGALTVTAGTVAGVYALVQANGAGWASVQTLGLLGAAVALLGAFLMIETRVAEPLMPLSIFRSRHVLAANVTMIAAGAAMFGLFFFLSLYLQQVRGYSALEAGVSQLPLAGSLVVAAGGAGALVERLGVKMVLMLGAALFAGGMLWFAQLPVDGQFLVNILGPSLLVGLGLALSFVALTIASVTDVQDTNYGLASGLINTSQQIGGALGLAILTALADQRTQSTAEAGVGAINDGYRLALLVGAGLAAVAFVAAAVLTPGGRRSVSEARVAGADVVAA
jgi:EmrB/QacA subfamily drug resistance transporter